MGQVILPTNVYVKPESLGFWWGMYALDNVYHDQIRVYSFGQNKVNAAAQIFTNGYFRRTRDAQISQSEFEAKRFGKTLEEISNENEIIYTPGVQPRKPEYFRLWGDRRVATPRFAIYHPANQLTPEVIDDIVSKLCRDFFRIPFVKVNLTGAPLSNEVFESFELWGVKFRDTVERYFDGDDSVTFHYTPRALKAIVDKKELERFKGKIVEGFEKNGDLYVRLKDGTEHRIGPPNLKVVK